MEQTLSEFGDTDVLVGRAARGDSTALTVLMDRYRERLKRMVALRGSDRS